MDGRGQERHNWRGLRTDIAQEDATGSGTGGVSPLDGAGARPPCELGARAISGRSTLLTLPTRSKPVHARRSRMQTS